MRDPKTEQFLDAGGWKWEYRESVPFSEIDIQGSRDNPSRMLRNIVEDMVEHYALEMQDGTEFPAIVLLTLDPESSPAYQYLVATGMHRLEAAQICDKTTFDAYVITEADLYRRDLLCRQLNTVEGQGIETRDRIMQVLYLNETYPEHSLKQLCQEWKLNYKKVKAFGIEQNAIKRARKFGFEFTKGKGPTSKGWVSLHAIQSDPVFQSVLSYIDNHAPPATEVDDLAREVKKARDEASALMAVNRYVEADAEVQNKAQAKFGRQTPANSSKFVSHAKTLNRILEGGVEKLHLSSYPRRDHAAILVNELIVHLQRVASELARIDRIEKGTRSATDARPAIH